MRALSFVAHPGVIAAGHGGPKTDRQVPAGGKSMLPIAIAGGGICAASLTAGLVTRTAIARSPLRRAGQAHIATPRRWRPLAQALIARDKAVALLAIWLMFLDTVI